MKNNGIIAAIVVFALIIVGMFVFAFLKKTEITEAPAVAPDTSETETGAYAGITRIDATHFFIDGTHTLVGELLMPTPCDLLNWDTSIAESMPEQVTVAFSVVNNSDMCIQKVTPQRFSVAFDASERASIRATLNGVPVDINLIPALEGERPEDFEVYQKG
jgi:hypothetical protein